MLRSRGANEDIIEHFSSLEKELCREMEHVTVRGKRGRGVPMLLNSKLVTVLEELVSVREKVGISKECPYLFVSGTAADTAPLRGSDCVRVSRSKQVRKT